jgi:hypothetical protein
MKKLLNPFALVVEGFVMGACIFLATGGIGAEEAVASTTPAITSQA